MAKEIKRTEQQIQEDKVNRVMNIVAQKAAFFRANPHRFAEVLGIHLKLFQKILALLKN